MESLHIIMCWAGFVFLIAAYLIARVCVSTSRVAEEEDIINHFIRKKELNLRKNELSMKISTYMAVLICSPIIIGVLCYIATQNALFTVILSVAGFFVPEGIVYFMKYKANREFEERYARSLEQLASSLKAGMTILQAVQEVAENKFIHESIREKYRKMSTDLQMGISVTEAFKNFAEGTANQDATDVAVAIDIQNEVGGHEAEVIMSIAKDIHDRIMLRHEIKSLFSGTSSMVYIMDVLPILVIVFLSITNASYLKFYTSSPLNMGLFCVIIVFCVTGSIINHAKLAKIMKGA